MYVETVTISVLCIKKPDCNTALYPSHLWRWALLLGVDEPPEVGRVGQRLEEGVVHEAAAHAVPPTLLARLEVRVVLGVGWCSTVRW